MTAPHLFAASVAGDEITIEGHDGHHAVRVLRLRAGEEVTVSDGDGNVATGVVAETGKSSLTVAVSGRRFVPASRPRVTVVQAVPKAGKFETIVQKLTELGVEQIVPLQAERSIARWDEKKSARMSAIAREAAKQSKQARIPAVSEAVGIGDLPRASITFVLHEEATAGLLASLPQSEPESLVLLVGPEGGFSREEVEQLRGTTIPVSLGSQILRTETAALVATALILGHYGRIG